MGPASAIRAVATWMGERTAELAIEGAGSDSEVESERIAS